jgi:hypothetical protein
MLILAIEPDRRQAAQIKAIAHSRLGAELVLADSADGALKVLGDRVPDLILTAAFLSPKDEATLNDRLRTLERAAQFVQTLTIPMLAAPSARQRASGMLSVLRREKAQQAIADGCDPAVFAEQCKEYLDRAAAERESHAAALAETAHREQARQPAAAFDELPAQAFDEPVAPAQDPFAYDATPPARSHAEPAWSQPEETASPPVTEAARVDDGERLLGTGPDETALQAEPEETASRVTEAARVDDGERLLGTGPDETSLQAEPEPEAAATPEPRAVVIHAEFPSAQTAKQPWALGNSSTEDETPTSDDIAVEMTPQVAAEPPVPDEHAAAPETSIVRDEDLELFDLDLDTLVNRVSDDHADVVAGPPQQSPVEHAGAREETDSGDDSVGTEDPDLEVYDLDLSALLGEPQAAEPEVGIEDHQPSEMSSHGSEEEIELELDEARSSAVTTAAKMAATRRDDDLDVYDLELDLNLLVPHAEEPSGSVEPPIFTVAMGVVVEARPSEPMKSHAAAMVSHETLPEEPTQREIEEDEQRAINSGAWAPLTTAAHRLWPRLEGGVVAQRSAARRSGIGPPEAPAFAVQPPRPQTSTSPKRPEWLNVIEALRRDNQRHRIEGEATTPAAPTVEALQASATFVDPPSAPVESEHPGLPSAQDSAPYQTPADDPGKGPSRSKKRRLARNAKKASRVEEPIRNDWGFFDPEEGGLSSLVTKLDEITVPK